MRNFVLTNSQISTDRYSYSNTGWTTIL